jgi:nucleoid-associated protein YgaU
MELKEKYQGAIDTASQVSLDNEVEVYEDDNKLFLNTKVKSPTEKELIMDKVQEAGGENPLDIMVEIEVEDDDLTDHKTYIVEDGDTLPSISEKIFGDRNRYMDIYNINQNILSDPNQIGVGQEIVLPGSRRKKF